MGSSWRDEMAQRQEAADRNECRELVAVTDGLEWKIRMWQEQFPQYAWRYLEGQTVPSYMLDIAKQLENEFSEFCSVPIDLYPCEYFRIMRHSSPTELYLHPKRFDQIQAQLMSKMHEFYETRGEELLMAEEHTLPYVACVVKLEDVWYRAEISNSSSGHFNYVKLVDYGRGRQVERSKLRYLDQSFGHYPKMVVKTAIRGAMIQRMDIGKIERFNALLENFNYTTRCQFITATEPFKVNMCHPTNDMQNLCTFLLAPRRGQASGDGFWLPKKIATDLLIENGGEEYREDEDSGASSNSDEEDSHWEGWDFDRNGVYYVRSLARHVKIRNVHDGLLFVERVEHEKLIFLASESQIRRLNTLEGILEELAEKLTLLPERWLAFGVACVLRHEGVMKRASIIEYSDDEVDVVLVDYGLTVKTRVSEVFSLPQLPATTEEPLLTLVSLAAYPNIHFSRTQILREILPRGTRVKFNRESRRSNEVPVKGRIHLFQGGNVEALVEDQITARNLDLDCQALVPYVRDPPFPEEADTDPVNHNFVYHFPGLVIYKKSKLVTSLY